MMIIHRDVHVSKR